MLYHPQQSPLIRPMPWLHDYALSAVFLALLRPWIEADIVELVQNPLSFDVDLFEAFRHLGEQRLIRKPALLKMIDETVEDQSMVAEMLLQHPKTEWSNFLSKLPLNASERDTALKAANSFAAEDPLRAAIPEWLNATPKTQIFTFGNGLSYDQAIALAGLRGAQIVTHERQSARILELDSEQLTGSFQQAAHSLSQVPLSFLNNVSADFAIGIRRDGKLRDFRQYIAGLTRGIQFRNTVNEYSASATKEFAERFAGEYNRYREEWKDIQNKLAAGAVLGAIGGAASSAAAFLTGSLAIFGPLATAATVGMTAALNAFFDRRKIERQPLGVALKLERSQAPT